MTPTIRYDADRQRITQRCATVFGWLTTAGHTPSHLRAKIDLAIEDGMRSARYDGDPGKKGARSGGDSHPERLIIGPHSKDCAGEDECGCKPNRWSDQACEDLERLDHLLAEAAKIEAELFGIIDRHDPITQRKAGEEPDKRKPGKGKAPVGKCGTCWRFASDVDVDRYSDRCRPCGDFRATHGQDITADLWRIHQRGKRITIADLRRHAPHLVIKVKVVS